MGILPQSSKVEAAVPLIGTVIPQLTRPPTDLPTRFHGVKEAKSGRPLQVAIHRPKVDAIEVYCLLEELGGEEIKSKVKQEIKIK